MIVRRTRWCVADRGGLVDNDRVVASMLGYTEVADVWGQRVTAPFRLAYLLDIPARNPAALVVLRQVLDLFLEHAQVPHSSQVSELNEQTNLLASNAVPEEAEFVREAGAGFGLEDGPDLEMEIFRICSAALRYLYTSVIIARGELEERMGAPGFDYEPLRAAKSGLPLSNGDIAAMFLSYPDIDCIRADPRIAAYRMGYLLDIPTSTAEAGLVLSRVLQLFVEETPEIPSLSDIDAMVRETGRLAGTATPFDDELRYAAAQGFDVGDAPDIAEAVCEVCDRAARYLFKAVIVARGETDRFLEGVS